WSHTVSSCRLPCNRPGYNRSPAGFLLHGSWIGISPPLPLPLSSDPVLCLWESQTQNNSCCFPPSPASYIPFHMADAAYPQSGAHLRTLRIHTYALHKGSSSDP